MRWLRERLSRRRRYDELSESIREHLDEKIADLMDDGMTRDEAERAARREFGNVTLIEERSREVWQWPQLESTLRDIRYGVRRLLKAPGFTVTVLVTLGIGIGATIAVYSLADAVLLRPLQFRNEKSLVAIFEERPALGLTQDTPAPANYVDWKRRNHVFSDMAAADADIFTITGSGRPEEVDGTRMTSNLLPLLGVEPILGRNFTANEDKPGNAVVLISAATWQQRFGSDPNIVGKTIHLNGQPYRIIGVMPFGFTFPERSSIWIPLALNQAQQTERDSHYLRVYGLLRSGVSFEVARREMADIARQLEHEYPSTNEGLSTSVVPLREQLLGRSREAIFVLAFGVAILLLITCANVAGLMVARAANRQRETAVRVALGARRADLLRQGLSDAALLSVGGGALGVVVALTSMPVLRYFVPETIAAWAHPEMNWKVLLFAMVVCVIVSVVSGFTGQNTAAGQPLDAMRQGVRGSTDGRQGTRSALVVGEIALTAIVLTSTGLLGGAFWKLAHTDLGFNPDSVLTVMTDLPVSAQTPYREFSARVNFYERVLERVKQIPGVKAAGYITFLPFTNPGGSSTVLIHGAAPLPVGKVNDVKIRVVTPDYFHALEIPLLEGRTFTEADGNDAAPAAIINQQTAHEYWPGQDAVGKQFRFDGPGLPWITVIGVVGDVRQANAETPSHSEMYFSYRQDLSLPGYFKPRDLAVRVAGEPLNYVSAVEHAVWSVDPEQPVSEVQSMQHIVDSRMETYILEAKVFAFFSGTALLLSTLGIYGLVSYSVTRRTQEVGIRMALGARREQVLASFVSAACRLLVMGLLLGAGGSIVASRLVGSMLNGIPGVGWGASLVPLLVLGVSVLVAAYIPARRAATIEPMEALRAE